MFQDVALGSVDIKSNWKKERLGLCLWKLSNYLGGTFLDLNLKLHLKQVRC